MKNSTFSTLFTTLLTGLFFLLIACSDSSNQPAKDEKIDEIQAKVEPELKAEKSSEAIVEEVLTPAPKADQILDRPEDQNTDKINQEPQDGQLPLVTIDDSDDDEDDKLDNTDIDQLLAKIQNPDSNIAQEQGVQYNIDGINPHDIVLGDANSKVVLIEYSSPTCPSCAYYHQKFYPKIKEKYIDTNKIAYVFRFFVANKQDLDGSVLAMCDMKKFSAFVDTIYSSQSSWISKKSYRDILSNIAQLGGLSQEQYEQCLNDEKIRDILALQSQKIYDKFPSRVVLTPCFLLNGTLLTGSHSFEALSVEIDKYLK